MEDEAIVRVGTGGVALLIGAPDHRRENVSVAIEFGETVFRQWIYIYRPSELTAFFRELARDWRGWDGLREWSSVERELTLACRHDRRAHVLITAALGPAPSPVEDSPSVSLTARLVVEPGSLDQIATALTAMLGS